MLVIRVRHGCKDVVLVMKDDRSLVELRLRMISHVEVEDELRLRMCTALSWVDREVPGDDLSMR